uniref:Protein kinase domain-containing protein n=1 Tax=Arcella intermedia TaxID=1963864 RepID=A0A6B2LD91_9EUKA
MMRDLVSILSHIHQQHIIHRDIKPENILLLSGDNDKKKVKLADFGSSCVLQGEDEKVSRMIGTLEYFAPEMLAEEPYGKAVDMWALGVTCFAMLTARCVFYDEDEEEKWNQVMRGDLRKVDELVGFSEESKDFMRRLLTVDPDQRMTALAAKDHPWLNSSLLPVKSKAAIPSPFIQRTNEVSNKSYISPFKANRMLSPINGNSAKPKPEVDKLNHVPKDMSAVKKDLNFLLEPLF